jgi:acetyltransferase-like isoleucine patch superfamily enzyme
MGIVRAIAAATRDAAVRARFLAWAVHLDVELRRRGGRLKLDAPNGLRFEAPPNLKVAMRGEGDGTLTLVIGRNVTIGRNVLLEVWAQGTNELVLDDDSYILDGARVLLRSGRIVLGARSNLRDYVQVKSQGDLILGEDVSIGYGSVLHCTARVDVHDLVTTGERVTMIDSEKRHDGSDTPFLRQPLRVDPVVVGRNTFVAANAVITHGSRVGPNAVVAAGAVLTGGDYPGGHILAGMPAKPVRQLAAAADDRGGGASVARLEPRS